MQPTTFEDAQRIHLEQCGILIALEPKRRAAWAAYFANPCMGLLLAAHVIEEQCGSASADVARFQNTLESRAMLDTAEIK